MENILQIIKSQGITLTEEQEKAIDAEVKKNYKTIADYQRQVEKKETAENSLKSVSDEFEKFKTEHSEEDFENYKNQVADLTQKLEKAQTEYARQTALSDLNALLRETAKTYKVINDKVIDKFIDKDSLLTSQNQNEDIKKAFDALKVSDPYLFQQEKEQPRRGSVIGGLGDGEKTESVSLRDALKEQYGG